MRGKTRANRPRAWALPRIAFPGLAVAAFALLLAGGASAVSLQPYSPASDADVVYAGGPFDLLPSALATGNWNNDSFDDVLACSWDNNSCSLFYGGPPSSWRLSAGDVTFIGPAGGFGGSATFIGDINGDGLQDIAIGAPFTAGAGNAVRGGSLWVFYGRPNLFRGNIGYYDADLIVFSTHDNSQLGWSAAAAGDMNGDGVDDFWVSAPADVGSGGSAGSLFLFLGKRLYNPTINETSAALVIEGVVPPASGGHVVLGGKDLNRDGRPDLVIASEQYTDGSGAVAGAAHVFLGPLPRAKAVLSTADADVQIWGTASVPSIGSSLAFAENFVVGGFPTLLIGAQEGNQTSGQGGAVYLFKSGQFACCQVLRLWQADGLIYSLDRGDKTGASLAVGDIDGDGLKDLIVGAPHARNKMNTTVGRAYIFHGNTTGRAPVLITNATAWIEGPTSSARFGLMVVPYSLNNDGKADFVVGAPGAFEGAVQSGAAYGFYGRLRNRAPDVGIVVEVDVEEGQEFMASANVSDLDDDRLKWWWSLGPGQVGYGNTDGDQFVPLRFPNDGEYTIRLTVFDGELYNQTEIRIRVRNAPPVCEIRVANEFVEGRPGGLAFNMSDPGADMLTYRWIGPEGLVANEQVAQYTAPRGRPFNVSVVVQDDAGASFQCNMSVPVTNVVPTVLITAPGSVFEGDYVGVGSVVSDPGVEENITVHWITPAGEVTAASTGWFAMTPGFFAIEVTATDEDGGVGSAHAVLQVMGRAPAVSLVVPTGIYEGDPANITVEQVSGQEYDVLSYTWSVCSYGSLLNVGPRFTIAHAMPGRFCIYVHVTDDDGAVVELEGSLNVANRPPLSGMTVSPDPPFAENQELTFRPVLYAWESTPVDEIRYNWSVNDVVVDHGRIFRAYLPAGDHRIGVEATDSGGAISRFTARIVIVNVPPLISIVGPYEVQPGALSTWVASASDPSGGAVTVFWEIDGEPSSQGPQLDWSSRSPGPHVIRAYARDESGAVSSDSITVEVLGPPTVGAGIDMTWIGIVVGASAAFAAGIVLGAYVLDRLRNRRSSHDEMWKN